MYCRCLINLVYFIKHNALTYLVLKYFHRGILQCAKMTGLNWHGSIIIYLQVDSTQNIVAIDQAAIWLRCIFNIHIKEQLFNIQCSTTLQVKTSSGKRFYELLKECFSQNYINFKNIIRSSFDEADNTRTSSIDCVLQTSKSKQCVFLMMFVVIQNINSE